LVTVQNSQQRTALIVGAGIGGLAARLALRRTGWSTHVFERAKNARELGFALLLAPNAMHALRQLGVAERVLDGGVVARLGEMRRPDGTVLKRIDAAALSAPLGEPTVCILRTVLYQILLDVGGHDVMLDSAAIGFDQLDGTVRLALANGQTATGDLLVGADGVGSSIRSLLHRDEPAPRPSGLFAIRGVAFDVAEHLGDLSGAQYFGRGIEAGLGRASERAVYWFMSVRADEASACGHDAAALVDQFAPRFHTPFRAIVSATRSEDLRVDELFERQPLDVWGAGHATLLGDAAHPMLPHAGQGAAQALEDAVALGHALANGQPIADGLKSYERARAKRTRAVIQVAHRNARVGSIRSRAGCWARDVVIRLVPSSVIAKAMISLARQPGDSTGA
jgi:2-polyprenyl-6-methoxyphenol hydroxylase-like FAD-dependent oxidoreductase